MTRLYGQTTFAIVMQEGHNAIDNTREVRGLRRRGNGKSNYITRGFFGNHQASHAPVRRNDALLGRVFRGSFDMN
jgi:hypothetical protein